MIFKTCLPLALTVAIAAAHASSAPAPVRVWESTLSLPTYQEGPPDPNPPFDLFVTGRFNYPYTIRDTLTNDRRTETWRTLHLENEYLRYHRALRARREPIPDPGWRSEYVEEVRSLGYETLLGD